MKTLENETNSNTLYNANGYKDRDDYLISLAQDFEIDIMSVRMISDMLGPSEDFDGLISELENFKIWSCST
jgi:hypothetical protein